MPYVMVPVPEEHVKEVMEFVIRTMARASIEEWDEESIESLFATVDEASRSLLSVVARAATTGQGAHRAARRRLHRAHRPRDVGHRA